MSYMFILVNPVKRLLAPTYRLLFGFADHLRRQLGRAGACEFDLQVRDVYYSASWTSTQEFVLYVHNLS